MHLVEHLPYNRQKNPIMQGAAPQEKVGMIRSSDVLCFTCAATTNKTQLSTWPWSLFERPNVKQRCKQVLQEGGTAAGLLENII